MQKEKDKVILQGDSNTNAKNLPVLNKHFKNNEDASVVVQEIEEIVDKKNDARKEVLASKDDIFKIEQKISNLEVTIERRFNQNIIWTISTAIALAGLLIALLKL